MKPLKNQESIKIIILDFHPIVSKGIELILKSNFKKSILYFIKNFEEARNLLKSKNIALLLVYSDNKELKNKKLLNQIKKINPYTKTLIFSESNEADFILNYIQNGFTDYVNKNATEKEILNTVNQILINNIYLKKESLPARINEVEKLSKRELQIAKLLVIGKKVSEISKELNLNITTISTYKRRLFEKLKIDNIVKLSDILKK